MCIASAPRAARGVTLIEQVVFIVIIGLAVTGVLAALSFSSRSSADPMIQKQALAIAEAVLEEVQLQPFTYCDPDDENAATAQSAIIDATTGCKTTLEGIGVEGGETRSGSPVGTPPFFDNVSDFHNYDSSTATPSGITNMEGSAIAGLDGYIVRVAVAGQALPGIPATEALLITVTVTRPASNTTVVLDGYRTRYAPNALP